MAGWHTRMWRRVRVAPGVTINLSKAGPSLSLGPRGSKVTFNRRGVRETVGIPGTGVFATRQLSSERSHGAPARPEVEAIRAEPGPPGPPMPLAQPAPVLAAPTASVTVPPETTASPAAPDTVEVYYGFATLVGIVFGVVLLVIGVPAGEAALAAILAIAAGIAYEGLAHHHPGPAKALVQVIVGLATLATVILGVLGVALVAGTLMAAGSSGRRRRRR